MKMTMNKLIRMKLNQIKSQKVNCSVNNLLKMQTIIIKTFPKRVRMENLLSKPITNDGFICAIVCCLIISFM